MVLVLRICICIKWKNRERYRIISPDESGGKRDVISHKNVLYAYKLTFILIMMRSYFRQFE
jgi:hypothetical protein